MEREIKDNTPPVTEIPSKCSAQVINCNKTPFSCCLLFTISLRRTNLRQCPWVNYPSVSSQCKDPMTD